MNAYLVSHNGLGDNLYMVGALRFLLQFYEKIYFLCKEHNYANVCLFFTDTPNIICILFQTDYEEANIFNIITPHYEDHDVFICGYSNKLFLHHFFIQFTFSMIINFSYIFFVCTSILFILIGFNIIH